VLLLAIALLAVGLVVPGALALLGRWETPKQFIADRNQPAYVRTAMEKWMNAIGNAGWTAPVPGGPERVTAVETVITADTPDGPARVYAFRFTHGRVGTLALLTREPRALAGSGAVLNFTETPRTCTRGWTLHRLGGGTARIGQTVGYVLGRASPRVASVHVLYRDGSTSRSAVGNGYFLAWMKPSAGRTNVNLIAENARGETIARLITRGSGFLASKPQRNYQCAY
jgi:hypothetical protein